jgi:hypothetical protein
MHSMIKICCLRNWARLCYNFYYKKYPWKTACCYSRHPPPPHPSDPFCHAVTGNCRYPSVPAAHPDLIFYLPHDRPRKSNPLPTHHNPSVMLVIKFADKRSFRQPPPILFYARPPTPQENQNQLPPKINIFSRS